MLDALINKIGFAPYTALVLVDVVTLWVLMILCFVFFVVRIKFENRAFKFSSDLNKFRSDNLTSFLNQNKLLILKITIFSFLLFFVFLVLGYYSTTPSIIKSIPANGEMMDGYSKPIEVNFNVPVLKSSLEPKINPKLAGHWEWENYMIPSMTTKGYFYLEETTFPENRIVFYIIGVSRALMQENHELALNITPPQLPNIQTTSPEDAQIGVARDSSIAINLDRVNDHIADFEFTLTPSVEVNVINPFSNQIFIKPTSDLLANTEYQLDIKETPTTFDLKENKLLEKSEQNIVTKTIKFTTFKEPLIESFTPSGESVMPDSSIVIKFSIAMDKDSVKENISMDPTDDLSLEWLDELTVKVNHAKPLEKDKEYKITIKSGTKSLSEDSISKDLIFNFKTLGYVNLLSSYPINGQTNVKEVNYVTFKFNQPVDHSSAEANLQISPSLATNIKWEDNDMILYGHVFNYNQQYTFTLKAGIKSLYGIDSKDDIVLSFTIRSQETIIGGVPQIYQPHGSFSCNIYAAIMALSWKGFSTNAAGLISEIGYNPNQSNGMWTGNPYTQYVGNADGSWGYGVYWTAVKRWFDSRGVQTEIKQGWNINDLATTIADGHPVVIWRYNGESSDYDKNWTASDGTYIRGINGQHGGLVIGVRVSNSGPTQFLVNDPWYGQSWFSASFLDYTWSRMNRTALVIY